MKFKQINKAQKFGDAIQHLLDPAHIAKTVLINSSKIQYSHIDNFITKLRGVANCMFALIDSK